NRAPASDSLVTSVPSSAVMLNRGAESPTWGLRMAKSYVTSAHFLDREQDRGQRSCDQARGKVIRDEGNDIVGRFHELVPRLGDEPQVWPIARSLEHRPEELGLV